jgi:hypothetical protein
MAFLLILYAGLNTFRTFADLETVLNFMKYIFILYPGLNQASFSPICTWLYNHIARYAHKHPCTAKQKISLIYHRIKFKTVSNNRKNDAE